jgi:site-specific DNA-cytosine methylase
MKVLIACEESQAVCKAFRELGHEAFSCDILPCSGGHPEWHIQDDVLKHLNEGWDLIIAFPPCTDLAVSGTRHFAKKIADGRQQKSIEFFMKFVYCFCKRIAIENPIGIMSSNYRKPDQIIQPYMFGHPAKKSTCLWLKNLPKLVPTEIVEPKIITLSNGKKFSADYMDGVKRSKAGESSVQRSKTYIGIAKAMASQWGAIHDKEVKQ